MAARISVVVPVYNVAAYLEPCLESLAQQTMEDLEVVLIDDGSTDESPEIARRFAAGDSRFRVIRQANAGLGAARNTGVTHAQGEFLAFVDSDDVVPPDAYELLLAALDESGSDFAAGNVERLTSFGTTKVGFLARAFERTRLGTHITRFPPLLADRTAWNKLFRKSFWDRHELRFPTGVFYEDTPVTLPAHYLASSVDVIEQTVYLWRMREGADLSITQRRAETKTLRDRVAAVEHVSRFLAEQRLDVSKALYDRSVVGHDLRYFLDVLPSGNDDYRRLFLDLANEFIDRADKWVLDQPLAIDRLKWQLVRRRALPELLEVLRFEDEELAGAPPVRDGRHWYGGYPYRTDARLRIPNRVYRLEEELASVFRVNEVRLEDGKLRVEGYAYINMIGAPEKGSQVVELFARRHSWPSRLRLETEGVRRPDVTANAAQELASLDWSGFVAALDLDRLKRRGRWRAGSWEIGIVVRAGGVVRRSLRAEPASLHAPAATLRLDDGSQIRAGFSSRSFTVEVRPPESVVRSHEVDEGVLQLEGEAGGRLGRELALELSRSGGAKLEYPAYVDRSRGRPAFLARIPLGDLVRPDSDPVDRADGSGWVAHLAGGGTRSPLALDEAVPERSWAVNGSEITLRRTPQGRMTLAETSLRPVITSLAWSPSGSLLVEGSFPRSGGEWELVLSHASRAEAHGIPLEEDPGTGRFKAELTPAAVSSVAGTAPLAEGVWQLAVGKTGAFRETASGAALDPRLLDSLPLSAEVEHKRFHVGVLDGGAPVLAVERDLAPDESGGFQQSRLRRSLYREKRTRELREAVLYDCFGGREYSDSPRAIHEELVRRGAPYEHLWIVRDGAYQVPDTAVPVRELSREYYEAYARARYIVSNDHGPRWFVRRSDQTSLQTWHGAPLKTKGYELADRPRAVRAYRRALAERAGNWQYVVSPGAFATPILQRAFPIGSEVLETGLPGTDLLVGADRDRLAEEVKRRLGVAGRRVVLYAPTYRDQLDYRSGLRLNQLRDLPTYRTDLLERNGYRLAELLDLGALKQALGDEYELLFRKHPRVLDVLPSSLGRFVRDVSDFPDVTGLLLAADVLVTDYSSLLFDFASTRRPIILFTPDMEAYRDEIRGFSIDFEAVAPGPLLRTTAEMIDALRDTDGVAATYRERYDRFVESYCSLSDGLASSRVVERVFRW